MTEICNISITQSHNYTTKALKIYASTLKALFVLYLLLLNLPPKHWRTSLNLSTQNMIEKLKEVLNTNSCGSMHPSKNNGQESSTTQVTTLLLFSTPEKEKDLHLMMDQSPKTQFPSHSKLLLEVTLASTEYLIPFLLSNSEPNDLSYPLYIIQFSMFYLFKPKN